jgi:hypothetical protein
MTNSKAVKLLFLAAAAALALAPGAPLHAQTPRAIAPGLWEVEVTIDSMDMHNTLPAIAKAMVGTTTRVRQCVTPEAAAQGPQELMKTSPDCVLPRYEASGGRLNAEMVCRKGASTLTATSTGAFTSTSFSTNTTSRLGGAMPMTMYATSVGRRLGECGVREAARASRQDVP